MFIVGFPEHAFNLIVSPEIVYLSPCAVNWLKIVQKNCDGTIKHEVPESTMAGVEESDKMLLVPI